MAECQCHLRAVQTQLGSLAVFTISAIIFNFYVMAHNLQTFLLLLLVVNALHFCLIIQYSRRNKQFIKYTCIQ